jgi:hypothetical protein
VAVTNLWTNSIPGKHDDLGIHHLGSLSHKVLSSLHPGVSTRPHGPEQSDKFATFGLAKPKTFWPGQPTGSKRTATVLTNTHCCDGVAPRQQCRH